MNDLDSDDDCGFEDRLRRELHHIGRSVSTSGRVGERFARHVHRNRVHARARTAAVAVVAAAATIGAVLGLSSGQSGPSRPVVVSGSGAPSPGLYSTPLGGALQWSSLPAAPLTPRMQSLAVWDGTTVVIWGGYTSDQRIPGDGAEYNPTSRTWTRLPGAPISGRDGPVGVWTGTEVLIYGGTTESGAREDGAAYDPTTRHWTHLPSAPLGGLVDSGSYVVWTGTKMLAWGFFGTSSNGSHGGGSRDIGIFDPATDTWQTGAPAPVGAPIFGDGFWTGREFIIVGPGTGRAHPTPIAVAYNPTTNTWHSLPPSPLSGNRDDMLAAWDGTELVVGGGYSNLAPGAARDVAAYNPTTDRWRSLTDAPQGFTGSNRYPDVWDGRDVITLDDGDAHGRPLLLDPATGIWRWGPPGPHPGLTETPAVWTGHEIIEWGGGTAQTARGGTECCQLVAGGVALASEPPTTNRI